MLIAITHNSAVAQDEGVSISNGFVNGTVFLTYTEAQQIIYTMGLVDGALSSPILYGANSKQERAFKSCVTGMTAGQLKDALVKHIKDHPLQRQINLSALLLRAIDAECQVFGG